MKPNFIHKELAAGRWFTLSLLEQLAHIGSEVHRALLAEGSDKKKFDNAVARALDLFDLTLSDPRLKGRLWEIARVRELFCDAVYGKNEFSTTLSDIDRYLLIFGMAVSRK